MCSYMTETLDRIASLPMAVIAAVEGAALGGGAELLTVCDWVFLSESSLIGFVHASLGVSPGWGAAKRLIANVGKRNTMQILCLAKKMKAEEAVDLGLADQVCAVGGALMEAHALAKELASRPIASVQAAIRLCRNPSLETEIFVDLWGGEAHRRALGLATATK